MTTIVTIANSAYSSLYIKIMNDYSVPLNTMSADCGPFNDYISPLCLISNSAHLELCRDPWTTVPLISRIITLWWSFLLLPMRSVNVSVRDLLTLFVPYFNILTLPSYFFTKLNVSCVQFFKISNMNISYFHSGTTVLLKYCVS